MTKTKTKVKKTAKTKKQQKQNENENNALFNLREELNMSRQDFAALTGASVARVAKWEKGAMVPTEFQREIIMTMMTAWKLNPDVGILAQIILHEAGVARALFLLFSHAYGTPTVLPALTTLVYRGVNISESKDTPGDFTPIFPDTNDLP